MAKEFSGEISGVNLTPGVAPYRASTLGWSVECLTVGGSR